MANYAAVTHATFPTAEVFCGQNGSSGWLPSAEGFSTRKREVVSCREKITGTTPSLPA
jgi:hypothetical protein